MTDPQRLDGIKARVAADEAEYQKFKHIPVVQNALLKEYAKFARENFNFVLDTIDSLKLELAQSALRTARADAMEEAARVADIEFDGADSGIAKAIRSLAQTGGEG